MFTDAHTTFEVMTFALCHEGCIQGMWLVSDDPHDLYPHVRRRRADFCMSVKYTFMRWFSSLISWDRSPSVFSLRSNSTPITARRSGYREPSISMHPATIPNLLVTHKCQHPLKEKWETPSANQLLSSLVFYHWFFNILFLRVAFLVCVKI